MTIRNIITYFMLAVAALICGLFASYIIITSTTISNMDKAKQDYVCKDSGGVYHYTWRRTVECRNGANYEWLRATISEEFYPDGRK